MKYVYFCYKKFDNCIEILEKSFKFYEELEIKETDGFIWVKAIAGSEWEYPAYKLVKTGTQDLSKKYPIKWTKK